MLCFFQYRFAFSSETSLGCRTRMWDQTRRCPTRKDVLAAFLIPFLILFMLFSAFQGGQIPTLLPRLSCRYIGFPLGLPSRPLEGGSKVFPPALSPRSTFRSPVSKPHQKSFSTRFPFPSRGLSSSSCLPSGPLSHGGFLQWLNVDVTSTSLSCSFRLLSSIDNFLYYMSHIRYFTGGSVFKPGLWYIKLGTALRTLTLAHPPTSPPFPTGLPWTHLENPSGSSLTLTQEGCVILGKSQGTSGPHSSHSVRTIPISTSHDKQKIFGDDLKCQIGLLLHPNTMYSAGGSTLKNESAGFPGTQKCASSFPYHLGLALKTGNSEQFFQTVRKVKGGLMNFFRL